MEITHLTQSVTSLGGGLAEVVRALACEQDHLGIHSQVISVKDNGKSLSPWPASAPQVLSKIPILGLNYVPKLGDSLCRSESDLLHLHGLWTYFSIGVPRWAKKNNVPYIISPHGMLEPWALEHSRAKKKLATFLFEREALRRASCLHALSQAEAEDIRNFGISSPIAIIPNGVNLPTQSNNKARLLKGKTLLFLGRLHEKKGLENALRAWAKITLSPQSPEKTKIWKFIIAGWDQNNHLEKLKNLCSELGLISRQVPPEELFSEKFQHENQATVIFTGGVFGKEKDRLLREADAFLLPSLSEGLPVSVLEAWSYALPVLMTPECNLPEGFSANASIKIQAEESSIADGMRQIFSANESELADLGERGRKLVKERFAWRRIAEQTLELYEWVIKGGSTPSFVEK